MSFYSFEKVAGKRQFYVNGFFFPIDNIIFEEHDENRLRKLCHYFMKLSTALMRFSLLSWSLRICSSSVPVLMNRYTNTERRCP